MDDNDYGPGPRIVEIVYSEDKFALPAHRLAAAIQEESRIAHRPQPRRRDTGPPFVARTITTILLAIIVVVLGAVIVLLLRP